MKAYFREHILHFKQASGTSRGIMTTRRVWFLVLQDNGQFGIGECAPLEGLSLDDFELIPDKLQWICDNIHLGLELLYQQMIDFPSIQMGLEMAFLSFSNEHPAFYFPSDFLFHDAAIKINGLIWMGDKAFMHKQIETKLAQGFSCIKLKIGAINWRDELMLLKAIRSSYGSDQIELRVDANGAFSSNTVMDKLEALDKLNIHSIEQPVSAEEHDLLARLCQIASIPIALDESLIGIFNKHEKLELLKKIRPKYIILKPSLVGGFTNADEWIEAARVLNIGWWITSALESNIGLNAIAQWTFTKSNVLPQGLGTGDLFVNNIEAPLMVKQGHLYYNKTLNWNFNQLI